MGDYMDDPNNFPGRYAANADALLCADKLEAFGTRIPKHLRRLIQDNERLAAALRRLSTAAAARDNVMGDPNALIAAKAELRDAEAYARLVLGQTESQT